jgi:hypothetical protein
VGRIAGVEAVVVVEEAIAEADNETKTEGDIGIAALRNLHVRDDSHPKAQVLCPLRHRLLLMNDANGNEYEPIGVRNHFIIK